MKIFLGSLLAGIGLGYDGCILAPAIDATNTIIPLTTKAHKKYTTQKFDSKFKFVGPLGEKLGKCSTKPTISNDGLYWILNDGAFCTDFYCNFKHDSGKVKFKKVSCAGTELNLESDFFNGPFTPSPADGSYLCPRLQQGVCAVPTPGELHPLPMVKSATPEQSQAWQSNEYHTCGRTAFLGNVAPITAKNGKQIGDSYHLFNNKKMFYYCDAYVPEKKSAFYKVSRGKKTGVFGQCKCVNTGEFAPFPKKICSVSFTGKVLGRYDSMAKKSHCDDAQFVLDESNGLYLHSESDINQCCKPGRCLDPNAICTDVEVTNDNFFDEAGYTCTCPSQYFDINQDGSICQPRACQPGNVFDETVKGCVNINECAGQHDCHADAVCTDKAPLDGQTTIDDFYSCTCKPSSEDTDTTNPGRSCVSKCSSGFTYDATDDTCHDIDECSLNTHNCVANSHCINTVGFLDGNEGYNCVCDSGFIEFENACIDVNECFDNPCAACTNNCSTCINQPGSFLCQCNDGYEGDGFNCTDVDECSNLDSYPISVHSDCVNGDGSYSWNCHDGYHYTNGTGTDCINIDECSGDPCGCDVEDPTCVATCTDNDGSYECSCNDGFELMINGTDTCTDIDECIRGTDDCWFDEKCINTIGGFYCDCDADHPEGLCDECKFNHHNCHPYAECTDTNTTFSCECIFGWSDRVGTEPGTDCKQDGDFYPLSVKPFEEGLSLEQRTGIDDPIQRSSQWPELPSTFGCPGRVWDRNIAGYIPTFNAAIKQNKQLYDDVRYKELKKTDADAFVEQVKFPEPENTWSWGTWGDWGEWSNTCTRLEPSCKLMHETGKPNRGWQTRERTCLIDGAEVCHNLCMPVDDGGLSAVDQKRTSKYPFINRLDREKAPREEWPVINGKKTTVYSFEEPFNPYYDEETDENALHTQHVAMYSECRAWGSFISPGAELPTAQDEFLEWIKSWDMEHPEDYSDDRKKRQNGEIYICTHQWRSCEETAQWVHTDLTGQTVTGWSEWSQCFAQMDETQCMVSGHPNGDFGSPYSLTSDAFSRSIPIAHHYQQRVRTCSTGCYQDCLIQELPDWKSDLTQFMKHSLTYQKFGDPKVDYSQSGTLNWRHCQHRIESWGCSISNFLTLKTDGKFPCRFPDIPEKSFTNGHLREGTVCFDMKSSMKRTAEAPFWTTDNNDVDDGVTMKCVCEPGCNICEWQMDEITAELGVKEFQPDESHFNGINQDYSFKGAVKHLYDESYAAVEAKSFRYWYADELPHLYGNMAGSQGLYMCSASSSTRAKPYFGTMFNSNYHKELSRPDKSDYWIWNQFMCRIGMRYTEGAILYFNEFSFSVFQIEDRSTLDWVDATSILTEDVRLDQIVTAADNNAAGSSNFTDVFDHWRINGACRIVDKCSERDAKRGNFGCTQEGNIWRVAGGSMRMHAPGTYATQTSNATAPIFCCKQTNYLHYAEPANKENNDDSWDIDYANYEGDYEGDDYDGTRGFTDFDRVIDQDQRLHDQDPRNLAEVSDRLESERAVVDEFARICDNRKVQILIVKEQKEITQWSAWSGCSVSCGTPTGVNGTFTGGTRNRQRVKILHRHVPGVGVFNPRYSKLDEDREVESETCNDFACHTPHWSEWAGWGNCGKKKNNEKWQKRTRQCWYNDAPLKEWEEANKTNKHTKTKKDIYCPKSDNIEWRCCCEETQCMKGRKSLCPWQPGFPWEHAI